MERELEAVNRFAKTVLTEEQVYIFSVRLCDNEVDRDLERFAAEALETLGELFVGKSGIFDHQWSARGQTARIYRTEMVREPSRVTVAGDPYCWLKGWAYLLRTEKTQISLQRLRAASKRRSAWGAVWQDGFAPSAERRLVPAPTRKDGPMGNSFVLRS